MAGPVRLSASASRSGSSWSPRSARSRSPSAVTAPADQYRNPFGGGGGASDGRGDIECAREIERAILNEGPGTVAAVIGEPISAAGGVHVPHPEYWPLVREICDRYGVLLICDEVITGFGRTGRMFATEHWGIVPDISVVAKALTSGYTLTRM